MNEIANAIERVSEKISPMRQVLGAYTAAGWWLIVLTESSLLYGVRDGGTDTALLTTSKVTSVSVISRPSIQFGLRGFDDVVFVDEHGVASVVNTACVRWEKAVDEPARRR